MRTQQGQSRSGWAQAFVPPALTPSRPGLLQRACGGPPTIQRHPAKQEGSGAPPVVHEVLGSPGRPLDQATRTFMVGRFGHDFGRVRVNTDEKVAESAQAVNAPAYTVGQDVVFAAGRYSPRTVEGKKLMAHTIHKEDMDLPSRAEVGPDDHPLEREAVVASLTPARTGVSGARVASSREILQRAAADGPDSVDRGDTLPYREATDLLECIRIMGQENAAYCRQEVLGEHPQPTPPPPPCSPTGLPRDQYLAQPGTTTDDFGLTTLAGTVTVPVVATTKRGGGVRLEETDAALPPITSVFTDTGTFTEGTSIFTSQGGDCRSGKYPIRWTIFPDGARKIREAELEHCADFRYAFEISLKRYADTVNRLSRSGRTFPSQRAAEAHISRLVGAKPANWGDIFACLARKTQRRDGQRGMRGWHTPRPRMIEPRLDTGCAFTRAGIGSSSLPEVGQHPPSEIIRDCGEGGAQDGARGAAQ